MLALVALFALAPHGHQEVGPRFVTSRPEALELPLPDEEEAFVFAIFGDRTGGPPEGVRVLEQAVSEVNLVEPDLVMTVGDLVQGYNTTAEWLPQMREFRGVMDRLSCPWFPVAGNHDVYWRGPDAPPGEHEASYEEHFGPLWYAFRHKRAWFVVLYSDEGDPATGEKSFSRPASQRMSPEQLAWLDETLERARDADHVLLFLHHPRWLGGGYGDDWERVHARLAAAGNVTAVFAGHIHRMRYDGQRDGIEYFALATTGGVQAGGLPEAGYLHHYHLVTVRPGRIAVAAFPVGSALDPRAITGTVSEEARAAADALRPRFLAVPELGADGAVEGVCELELENPVSRPLDVTITAESGDPRWSFEPDHVHAALDPGETLRVAVRVHHPATPLDAAWRLPDVVLRADYLAPGWRVPLPRGEHAVPLDPGALTVPAIAAPGVLHLDGVGDALRVESAELDLPDGPLTVEGWLRADDLRGPRGFVTKTEGSELGLFASDGKPSFLVHLGGAYAEAAAADTRLAPRTWHHVAGCFDGAELRLYVDGALVARSPASGTRTRNDLPLLIGADVDGRGEGTSFLAGLVDEVRVSRVARYGDDFEPARRLEPDGDTALLLHLDAPLGPWAPDASAERAHALALDGARLGPE